MAIELYSWKHPRTGQKRYYFNAWKEAIGLSLDFYKSGNICAASLRGEHISNSRAGANRIDPGAGIAGRADRALRAADRTGLKGRR